ncbi:MAG: helix-turn-helix domain-containing protein [Balneolales bacterium]|nr:helix-turn-helix domain-containing protein [Balneolales bacterium]
MEHRINVSDLLPSELSEMNLLLGLEKKPALVDAEGNRTEIPDAIFQLLKAIVSKMKQGESLVLMPENETFTTQAAANFLGVSRQHLVDLIENGAIPFHKAGSHRRIYFKDLKAYAASRDKQRGEALDQLFGDIDKAGKYNSDYKGNDS